LLKKDEVYTNEMKTLNEKLKAADNVTIEKDALKDRVDAASEEIKSLTNKLNVSVQAHSNDIA
jgi:hypothetical protein